MAFFRGPSVDSAGWSGREKMSGTGKARHSDDRRPMSKFLSGREKMGRLKRPPSGKKRTPAGKNPAILPALPPPASGRSAGSGCRVLRISGRFRRMSVTEGPVLFHHFRSLPANGKGNAGREFPCIFLI
ncbi:MAG: hypothetical protein C6W56_11740 [Caldibacillus debilis]|nr:MAG: hypothetical protein C6W56_11740 [Caldibacillus debilis]